MMKISKPKQALILGATLVALGAGAIGTTVVIAQDADTERSAERSVREDGLRHLARDGKRGHRGGQGNRHGGELMMNLFDEVDADGDGALTQQEIDSYRADRVGAVDASGDGALDLDEFDTLYREFTRPRMVDAFQRLDDDGDGSISESELDERFGGIVERLDRNEDGALSIEDRGRRHRG